MSKVITVMDVMKIKNPAKYEELMKAQKKETKKLNKQADEKRALLAEIQSLQEENDKLTAALKEYQNADPNYKEDEETEEEG